MEQKIKSDTEINIGKNIHDLRKAKQIRQKDMVFRSTGSYEPDQQKFMVLECFLHYFLFKSSKYDI